MRAWSAGTERARQAELAPVPVGVEQWNECGAYPGWMSGCNDPQAPWLASPVLLPYRQLIGYFAHAVVRLRVARKRALRRSCG